MPLVELSDADLERAARAARLAAGMHERGVDQSEAPMAEYLADQARRFRALAAHLEEVRGRESTCDA